MHTCLICPSLQLQLNLLTAYNGCIALQKDNSTLTQSQLYMYFYAVQNSLLLYGYPCNMSRSVLLIRCSAVLGSSPFRPSVPRRLAPLVT